MQNDNIAALAAHIENDSTERHPLPLMQDTPPETAVPVNALNGVLSEAVLAIHAKVQAPLATCLQSGLAVATLATQAHANVLMPTQQERPLSNNFMTISESGERKSSADSEAMKPVRLREAELRKIHESEMPDYRDEKEAWEKARAKAQIKNGVNVQALKSALQALGSEPQPPLHPMLTCDDLTIEGLFFSLSTGQASQGVFSAEGGQFFGGQGMNKDNKLKTATALSCLWDSAPVRRVRRGDGVLAIEGRRLTSHLMLQPGVASLAFGDPVLSDQGFMSRQLAVMPAPLAGGRTFRPATSQSLAALDAYTQYTLNILQQPYPLQQGKRNELAPRPLPLSATARQEWEAFYNAIEGESGSGGRYDRVRPLANKLGEHSIRLAGVLTLYDNLSAGDIPVEKMQAGILLAEYYIQEALRITGTAAVDAKIIAAQKLLHWLQSRYPHPLITYTHVYKNGRAGFTDAASTKSAFKTLEDHGYIAKLEGRHYIDGKAFKDVYRIHGKA